MINVLKIICLCITHTSDHGHRAWYNSSLPLIIYAEWSFSFAFASAVMIKQGGQSHLCLWDSTIHSNSAKQFKYLLVSLLHWIRMHLWRCRKTTLSWNYMESFPLVAHRTKNLYVESLPNRARGKTFSDVQIQHYSSQNWFFRASRGLGRSRQVSLDWLTCKTSNTNTATSLASLKLLLFLYLQQCHSFAKKDSSKCSISLGQRNVLSSWSDTSAC